MSDSSQAADDSPRYQVPGDTRHEATDDALAQRISRALRSREGAQPDAADVIARIEARLAQMPARTQGQARAEQASQLVDLTRRGGKIFAAGVVITAIATVGAGAAAAANPYSNVARTVEDVARTVGIDWSAMPDGYTRAQYDAFWGAGYTAADVDTLGALWNTETTETKARAGQMILDGAALPIAPGSTYDPSLDGTTESQLDAFWGAGYTWADAQALGALWNSEAVETKARAGQMILDGQTPPIAPGTALETPAG